MPFPMNPTNILRQLQRHRHMRHEVPEDLGHRVQHRWSHRPRCAGVGRQMRQPACARTRCIGGSRAKLAEKKRCPNVLVYGSQGTFFCRLRWNALPRADATALVLVGFPRDGETRW
jgi:hypothetical protein